MSSIKMNLNMFTPSNIQKQINQNVVINNLNPQVVRMNMTSKINRNCAALMVQGNKRCSSCGQR